MELSEKEKARQSVMFERCCHFGRVGNNRGVNIENNSIDLAVTLSDIVSCARRMNIFTFRCVSKILKLDAKNLCMNKITLP